MSEEDCISYEAEFPTCPYSFETTFTDSSSSYEPSFDTTQPSANLSFSEDIFPVIDGNYENLENKPRINGVTLVGDKTNEELHIDALTNEDIETIFARL